jgi:hypothetical protein
MAPPFFWLWAWTPQSCGLPSWYWVHLAWSRAFIARKNLQQKAKNAFHLHSPSVPHFLLEENVDV